MADVAACVAAALANPDVQAWIELGKLTRKMEVIDPHVRRVFELGFVVTRLSESNDAIEVARKKKLGRGGTVQPLRETDSVSPWFSMIGYGPKHPRRVNYERRAKVRDALPQKWRKLVMQARRLSKFRFVKSLAQDASDAVKSAGFDPEGFWRAVR